MSDRTRTPAIASGFAAGLLLATALLVLSASIASAQATQTKPPPVRHVDVEAGAGVHWGMANDVPIEDDLYPVLGLAAPILGEDELPVAAVVMSIKKRNFDLAAAKARFGTLIQVVAREMSSPSLSTGRPLR